MIPYTITNDSVTVVLKGESHTIKKGDPNYEACRQAVLNAQWDKVPRLISKGMAISDWTGGFFRLERSFLFYKDRNIDAKLNAKILEMVTKNMDPRPLMRFWARLQENPSYRSVEQLYSFMAHEGIPITTDGYFLAYKSVRRDYLDHHSRTLDNSPGKTLEMPRNQISDDPHTACHVGLHVGALAYARTFGSHDRRIVICKVNPRDVVCVPYDSSQHKMRVCKYTVLGNHGDQLPDYIYDVGDDEALLGHVVDVPEGFEDLFEDTEPEKAEEVAEPADNVQDFAHGDDDYDEEDSDDVLMVDDAGAVEVVDTVAAQVALGLAYRVPKDLNELGRDAAREVAKQFDIPRRGRMSAAELRSSIVAKVAEHGVAVEVRAGAFPGWITPEPSLAAVNSMEEAVDRGEAPTNTPVPAGKSGKSWERFSELPIENLAFEDLGDLRKYASRVLKIVGASKIRGGKSALIERIADIRK